MGLGLSVSVAAAAAAGSGAAPSRTDEAVVELPPFVLLGTRVANEEPVGTFPMPVSGLRFEPLVDIQARNLAEGQADVTVRGGIFENTGFRVGTVSLFDPQTGHYFAEIPIAPAMLLPVRVATGSENAFGGFNSTVATLSYDWAPIRPRGEITLAAGGDRLRRGSVYVAAARPMESGFTVGVDADFARSRSDGPLPGGDHDFTRATARLQWRSDRSQTDLFTGYQEKFFGWPNLYTPFGFLETEDLATTLVVLEHRLGERDGDYLAGALLWRRHVDDYEVDRTRPGLSNPFEHETRVVAGALEGRRAWDEAWAVRARAEIVADEIESTALTFGRFRSRTYLHAATQVEHRAALGDGQLTTRAGGVFDTDNRGRSFAAPAVEVAWADAAGRWQRRFHVESSGSSQVPGYTALASNPSAGLFLGNPNLGRERSRNWEVGAALAHGDRWSAQAALFHRADRDLVDWTFRQGVTARRANAVDIDTTGFEAVVTHRWPTGRVVVGYTWLDKDADYGDAAVDASFYALNFARHRATLAVVWRPVAAVELRVDHEWRRQQPNFLRRSGSQALLGSAGLHWFPPFAAGFEVSAQVDNLWQDRFEEVPAVPAAPRRYALGVAYRW
jgi:vitamin B12 transporter